MITILHEQKIRTFAHIQKKPVGVIEKDYALEWLLYGIYHKKSKIKSHLIFKGGTAIRKTFFPQTWRFSEDLDFTVLPDINPDIIKSGLEEICDILKHEVGIKYENKVDLISSEKAISGSIHFTGPLGYKNKIKIDISRIEKMLDPIEKRPIITSYEDLENFQINCYTLHEIMAEKIRSMMERNKVRDYYDVWKMLSMNGRDVNTMRLANMVQEKCPVNDVEYNPSKIFDSNRLDNLRVYWNENLKELVVEDLPSFDSVIDELQHLLKFLPKT